VVRDAAIDRAIFDEALRSADNDPNASGESAKVKRGRMQIAVEDAIDAEQRRRQRRVTREESKKVTQGVVPRQAEG
jgi:hypothetical protein